MPTAQNYIHTLGPHNPKVHTLVNPSESHKLLLQLLNTLQDTLQESDFCDKIM